MTTKDHKYGDHILRTMQSPSGWVGIVVGDANNRFSAKTEQKLLEKLQVEAHSKEVGFVGWTGALTRFLTLFPLGFADPNYVGDQNFGEQMYKRSMAKRTQIELPLDSWRNVPNPAETALSLFRGTNLIDPYTKTALQNCLRSDKALEFLGICEMFALGDIKEATARLANVPELRPVQKWTALTYLPFFWAPESHFFLKPKFTQEFASRVGHSFAIKYQAEPNYDTYNDLLDLANLTIERCKELPSAQGIDHIDVHSFMWTVVDYGSEDVGPPGT